MATSAREDVRIRRRLPRPAWAALVLAAAILAAWAVQRSLARRVRGALLEGLAVDPDAHAVVAVEDVRISLAGRRVEVRGLSLRDGDGLRFAHVARASARFGLGSLRRGRVEIRRVAIEGLDVRADAVVFAAFLTDVGAERRDPPASREGTRFVVRRIDVRDAGIVLIDDRGREQFAGRIEEAGIRDLGTRDHPMAGDEVVRLAAARILEAAGLSAAAPAAHLAR